MLLLSDLPLVENCNDLMLHDIPVSEPPADNMLEIRMKVIRVYFGLFLF